MMPSEKPASPGYDAGDCVLAALAGALANSLALGWLGSGSRTGGIFLLITLFTIGFVVLVFAGKPMARKLAAEGRDTFLNGLLLGAAIGSLTAALLAGVLVSSLFGSPSAAFSMFSSLSGLYFGVIDGAVAGLTFVWLGRRKFAASSLEGAERQVDGPTMARFRWSWVLIVLGLGIPAAAIVFIGTSKRPEPKAFPIAGVVYQWPADTTVSPPQPPGYYGKGFVSYRSSSRYPDEDAFLIIYDGNAQEALNEAALPHLKMITSKGDDPRNFSFRTTPAGQVVCNRRSVQVGLAFPCGLSFVHRGARWQLHFGAHQMNDAEQLYEEAVSRLETYRR
jgi:hypothetical protein